MREREGLDLARLIAERVADGRLSREEAEAELAEKFGESCPGCQRLFDDAVVALYSPAPVGVLPRRKDRQSLERTVAGPPRPASAPGKKKRCRALPPEVLVARSLAAFATLENHGWPRRRERVRLEWQRFRGVAVAERMLAAAVAELPASPEEAARWAEMVLLVLGGDRHPATTDLGAAVLRLRARLLQVNAARCRGELDEAAAELRFTILSATTLDVRDLGFWVEAKRYSTPLHRDLREFAVAVRSARAWAALARATNLPVAEVQARWSLASVHEQKGDFTTALAAIQLAVPLLPKLNEPVLELGIRHSHVSCLAHVGRYKEAEEAQAKLGILYRTIPGFTDLKLWVSGYIHAGLGRPPEAEADFRAARDGFLTARNAYDAALVTLDWSLFLLDQGRADEVLPLAVSMGQAFEALGVARETLASWAIFQAAAERRELDRAVAESLVRTLGEERGVRKARAEAVKPAG